MDADGTVSRLGQILGPMELHLRDMDAFFLAQNQGFLFQGLLPLRIPLSQPCQPRSAQSASEGTLDAVVNE